MYRVLSQEEVDRGRERVMQLYQSEWTVDNLTAVLMDVNKGGTGVGEELARAKAHDILNWLHTIVQIEVPEKH